MSIFKNNLAIEGRSILLLSNGRAFANSEDGKRYYLKSVHENVFNDELTKNFLNVAVINAAYSAFLHKMLVGSEHSTNHYIYTHPEGKYFLASQFKNGEVKDTKEIYRDLAPENNIFEKGRLIKGFTTSLIAHEILRNEDYDICFIEPNKKGFARKAFSVDFDMAFIKIGSRTFEEMEIDKERWFSPENLRKYFHDDILNKMPEGEFEEARFNRFSDSYLTDLQIYGALKTITKNYERSSSKIEKAHNYFLELLQNEIKKAPKEVTESLLSNNGMEAIDQIIYFAAKNYNLVEGHLRQEIKNINNYLLEKQRGPYNPPPIN